MKMEHEAFQRWNKLARSFLGDDFFESIVEKKESKDMGPKADVYHSQQEVIVVLDLPGIEDLRSMQYQVEKDMVTVSGVIPNPYYGYTPFSEQCFHGQFQKEIPLGAAVLGDKRSIRYRRGVLEIRFPKEK